MARIPQKLSRTEVLAETAKFLAELRAPEAQKQFDWIPELTGLMEELQRLAQQDAPGQTKVAELSSRACVPSSSTHERRWVHSGVG